MRSVILVRVLLVLMGLAAFLIAGAQQLDNYAAGY